MFFLVCAHINPNQQKMKNNANGKRQLWTKEDVRRRLNLQSTRGVDGMVKKRMIEKIVLGHKTVRFEPEAVEEAIRKFSIKAIG